MTPQLRALLRKELLEVWRNAWALLPVVAVFVVALVLPFIITALIPWLTGERLSDDADLARLSEVVADAGALTPEGRVQLFFYQQFLIVFLLIPITGAMALAAHAVIGEKQARTLEPMLATPIRTTELLVAKALGALLPTLAVALVALLLYFAGIAQLAEPGVARAMLSARTALLVLVIGPATSLLALQGALIVSSRVNDARTAQQFGVLLILPLTALLVAQFTGAVWLSLRTLGLIGLGLFAAWVLLTLLSAALFEREAILTRWR
jgi:ABC-2 type transport system permease protein